MTKKIIATDNAPKAIGAYSQGVVAEGNRLLYVSGQIGLDPRTGELVPGGCAVEAAQALKNIEAVLKAAGGSFQSIVKATIILADMNDFAAVNTVYAACFPSDPPARAAFAAAALPRGARVEIEAIAIL
jgi:2-iminobutanoate/2-iminopropanoate deaminase